MENVHKCAKCLPKCLSLSSQMFRDTGSRRFRIAKTTINSTAMPIVKSVPVNKAANGKIDRPKPPSVDEKGFNLISGFHIRCKMYRSFFFILNYSVVPVRHTANTKLLSIVWEFHL